MKLISFTFILIEILTFQILNNSSFQLSIMSTLLSHTCEQRLVSGYRTKLRCLGKFEYLDLAANN